MRGKYVFSAIATEQVAVVMALFSFLVRCNTGEKLIIIKAIILWPVEYSMCENNHRYKQNQTQPKTRKQLFASFTSFCLLFVAVLS